MNLCAWNPVRWGELDLTWSRLNHGAACSATLDLSTRDAKFVLWQNAP